MAQATYVHDGRTIDYTPGSAVAAGDVVLQGNLFGIANVDIAANKLGALSVEGVFDLTKQGGAGVTFAVGAAVYWDDGNNRAVATDGGGANKKIGTCTKAAADADVLVRTKLVPA